MISTLLLFTVDLSHIILDLQVSFGSLSLLLSVDDSLSDATDFYPWADTWWLYCWMWRFSCISVIFFDLFSQATCCLLLLLVKEKASVRVFGGEMYQFLWAMPSDLYWCLTVDTSKGTDSWQFPVLCKLLHLVH